MQLSALYVRLHYRGPQTMLNTMLERLFGCSHRRTTFPLTPKRPAGRAGAYVTCLDCGKEFAYNWNEMRLEEPVMVPTVQTPSEQLNRPVHALSRLLRLGN